MRYLLSVKAPSSLQPCLTLSRKYAGQQHIQAAVSLPTKASMYSFRPHRKSVPSLLPVMCAPLAVLWVLLTIECMISVSPCSYPQMLRTGVCGTKVTLYKREPATFVAGQLQLSKVTSYTDQGQLTVKCCKPTMCIDKHYWKLLLLLLQTVIIYLMTWTTSYSLVWYSTAPTMHTCLSFAVGQWVSR